MNGHHAKTIEILLSGIAGGIIGHGIELLSNYIYTPNTFLGDLIYFILTLVIVFLISYITLKSTYKNNP